MSDAIWIALIVSFPTIIGPSVAVWVTSRSRSREKVEDWRRQDAVAAQAAAAATLLIESNKEVADAAVTAAIATSAQLEEIKAQGDVIHTLVNKNLTIVTEKALAVTEELLVVWQSVEPTKEALKRISEIKADIEEQKGVLQDRAIQQAEVDAGATKGGE